MEPRTQRILDVILAVPRGRVVSYGQVAELAGLPGRARMVGRVLRELPDGSAVPWHRVLGAGGLLRIPHEGYEDLQRSLLESEGVEFRGTRVDMERFGWRP